MFVKNETRYKPALARTAVSEQLAVGAIVVESVWRSSASGLVPWEGSRQRLDTDAPSTAKQALWEGTSVTMAATVRGPQKPPYLARIELEVAAEKRSVTVFGDRQWVRNAGRLVASAPARFEQKPLSWSLAFGGAYDLPPGLDPVRHLPHPGYRVGHPLNPGGIGFYQDEKAAEGSLLPSIEWRDEPTKSWDDRPTPAGLSPCPDLPGLRAPQSAPAGEDDVAWYVHALLRQVHHAPRELIFDTRVPGTAVRTMVAGASPMAFEIPESPLRVVTTRSHSAEDVRPRVRSVHVSLDDGAVIVQHGHSFGHEPNRPPSWVRIQERR